MIASILRLTSENDGQQIHISVFSCKTMQNFERSLEPTVANDAEFWVLSPAFNFEFLKLGRVELPDLITTPAELWHVTSQVSPFSPVTVLTEYTNGA